MKVLVQHTTTDPGDYVELDSSEWSQLPVKSVPTDADPLNREPGWIFDLMIQGISFGGADHYCVEDIADGGVRVIVWNDDSDDIPESEFSAQVWTLMPLAPDDKLNGAINTRQSKIIYAAPARMARIQLPIENTEVRPWSEFVPPAEAESRHGVWVHSFKLLGKHQRRGLPHSWREWGEHLDPSELDESGAVKAQRPQGRYDKPQGTITYFLHDTVQASGVHVAGHELEMEETDVASSVNVVATVGQASDALTHLWSTLTGSPNDADWPNGAYRCQIDVQSAMLIDGYGFLTRAGSAGHMARVNSGLTADQQTWTQDETAFTGTGIKLATNTIDPSSGAAGDRFECVLAADNSDTMMDGTLTVRCDDTDSFADGPWSAAADASDEEWAATQALGGLPPMKKPEMVAY